MDLDLWLRRSLFQLTDDAIEAGLAEIVARDRTTTSEMLEYIGEHDDRRIHVARAARRVPALLGCIAEGRLHLSGASLLVPHLTTANAEGLLSAAVTMAAAAGISGNELGLDQVGCRNSPEEPESSESM